MSKRKEIGDAFWVAYEEELREELNFKLILEYLSFEWKKSNQLYWVERVCFTGSQYPKVSLWKRIWYFLKKHLIKKRKKELRWQLPNNLQD